MKRNDLGAYGLLSEMWGLSAAQRNPFLAQAVAGRFEPV